MTEPQLSQLFIYPVKSLGGVAVKTMELTPRGPKWDRRWMLVDAHGQFLSQREVPQMTLLRPRLKAGHLCIEDVQGGRPALEVPLHMPEGTPNVQVQIWEDTCTARYVSGDADHWFSEALDTACRLVYMPDSSLRPVDAAYARGEEWVSFADGYPYLIIGEASLNDLNGRLEVPIGMERFRPNLVFSGGSAFAEDQWQEFLVGPARFRGAKRCARCQIPAIDQHTGISSKEPTRTLATYRRHNNKVYFGLNACWQPAEEEMAVRIAVGDQVQPLRTGPVAPI